MLLWGQFSSFYKGRVVEGEVWGLWSHTGLAVLFHSCVTMGESPHLSACFFVWEKGMMMVYSYLMGP